MHSRNSVRLVGLLVSACAVLLWNAGLVAAAAPTAVDTEQIDVITVTEPMRTLPDDLTLRARVTSLAEPGPVTIRWRYGGETQGGAVISGTLGENLKIGQWTEAVPFIERVLEAYGPERMIWGSDFPPVCGKETVSMTLEMVRTWGCFSEAELEWVLGKSAMAVLKF